MKKIEFLKLYDLDYNLSNLFAVRQYWKENASFKMVTPRKTSCLLYFCGCSANYRFGNDMFTVGRGSVMYIPEGAVYETHFLDCEDCVPSTILIEFSLIIGQFSERERTAQLVAGLTEVIVQ